MSDKEHRDRQALEAERSGNAAGVIYRFFEEDQSPGAVSRRERGERSSEQTRLQLLLANPAYREAYDRVWTLLDTLQDRIDQAIERVTANIERLTDLVDDYLDSAATNEDGEAVFLSADGHVYTADGRRLSDAQAASLHIPPDSPSYERYTGARDALHSARARLSEITGIQDDVLDPARRRMQDPNDPPSYDDLDGFKQDALDKLDLLSSLQSVGPSFTTASKIVESEQRSELLHDMTFETLDY